MFVHWNSGKWSWQPSLTKFKNPLDNSHDMILGVSFCRARRWPLMVLVVCFQLRIFCHSMISSDQGCTFCVAQRDHGLKYCSLYLKNLCPKFLCYNGKEDPTSSTLCSSLSMVSTMILWWHHHLFSGMIIKRTALHDIVNIMETFQSTTFMLYLF